MFFKLFLALFFILKRAKSMFWTQKKSRVPFLKTYLHGYTFIFWTPWMKILGPPLLEVSHFASFILKLSGVLRFILELHQLFIKTHVEAN